VKPALAMTALALAIGAGGGRVRAETSDKVTAPVGRPGEVAAAAPPEMAGVELNEKLGAKIPLDLAFTDETGAPIRLSSLFGDGKPVLLTFNYSSCPMLCSVQLGGLVKSLNELTWSAGVEFRVITIGLNPMESHRQAMTSKIRYLDRYKRSSGDEGWRFLTGTERSIRALAASVGYGYRVHPSTGEFLHPAAVTVLSPDGVVSSYVYGVEYPAAPLAVTLMAARKGQLLEATEKFLMACFHYDSPKGNAAVALRVMQIGGIAFVGVMLVVFGVTRATRRQRSKAPERSGERS
jgi:protein SCO1